MIYRFLIKIALIGLVSVTTIYSQGCSDAGFCTMGAMRPNQHVSNKIDVRLKSIEFTQYLGVTPFKDFIHSSILDFNVGINKNFGFQVKVPYMMVVGALAKTHGLGDISLAITQTIVNREEYQLLFTLGGKIPTNDASLTKDGRPLPMYYQTSLGTYDLVLGASFLTKKWLISTGFQHPFNKNGNKFLWGPWNRTADSLTASHYPRSKELDRGDDVMLRIERNFRFSRFNFFVGILSIYRLNNDVFTFPDRLRREWKGSDGLATTLTVGAGYMFNVKHGIKLLGGIALIQRKFNPDGLSRDYVATVSYQYRF